MLSPSKLFVVIFGFISPVMLYAFDADLAGAVIRKKFNDCPFLVEADVVRSYTTLDIGCELLVDAQEVADVKIVARDDDNKLTLLAPVSCKSDGIGESSAGNLSREICSEPAQKNQNELVAVDLLVSSEQEAVLIENKTDGSSVIRKTPAPLSNKLKEESDTLVLNDGERVTLVVDNKNQLNVTDTPDSVSGSYVLILAENGTLSVQNRIRKTMDGSEGKGGNGGASNQEGLLDSWEYHVVPKSLGKPTSKPKLAHDRKEDPPDRKASTKKPLPRKVDVIQALIDELAEMTTHAGVVNILNRGLRYHLKEQEQHKVVSIRTMIRFKKALVSKNRRHCWPSFPDAEWTKLSVICGEYTRGH